MKTSFPPTLIKPQGSALPAPGLMSIGTGSPVVVSMLQSSRPTEGLEPNP